MTANLANAQANKTIPGGIVVVVYALFQSLLDGQLFALQEGHESGNEARQTSALDFKAGASGELELIGAVLAPARALLHTIAQERAESLLMA